MKNSIMTVAGPIAPDSLGFCQCHEHLMISKGVSAQINPAILIDDPDKSTAEVILFHRAGGNTIIDAQPGGCNRMETALLNIAQATGVNIIAAAGFHKFIFYPKKHWLFTESVNSLTNFFIHELTIGMYTDIDRQFPGAIQPDAAAAQPFTKSCAGIIKAALDTEGLTPMYEKCFRAAVAAAVTCDVPLMVHIETGADCEELLAALLSWGMNPHRIIFCHMDRNILPLTSYHQLLTQGIFLEFDTIGRFKYHRDEEEAALFTALVRQGFEDQLLFSLDTTRERMRSYNDHGIGLDYILTSFLPLLEQYQITPRQIAKISHDNVIRAFTK